MEIMRKMNKDRSKLMYIIRICLIFVFFLTSNFSCSFINNFKNSKEPVIKQSNSSYLYANPSRNAVYDTCSNSSQLKVKWKYQTLREDGGKAGILPFPIAYDNMVFIGDVGHINGRTYALDIKTGKVVWEKEAEFGPITISDGIIYFLGQAGAHYAVEAKTGKELWSINMKRSFSSPFSSPIVYENLIYVSGKDAIYALNAKTGEEIWKYKEDEQFSNSDLVLIDDTFFCQRYYPYADLDSDYWIYGITTDLPDLLILNTKTGKEVKRYKSVYFHGYDEENFYLERRDTERKMSFLVAVDRKTDKENWKFQIKEQSNLHLRACDERIRGYLLSKDNKLYFSAINGSVYCLNSDTGKLIWETTFEILPNDIPSPGNSPSLCENKLYVVMDECLYVLDTENGEKLFKFSTGGHIWSNPFIYRNKIFITSNDCFLYCLE